MAKEIDKIIQSKTAPKSNNVLWDDGENLKINRNGKWENTGTQVPQEKLDSINFGYYTYASNGITANWGPFNIKVGEIKTIDSLFLYGYPGYVKIEDVYFQMRWDGGTSYVYSNFGRLDFKRQEKEIIIDATNINKACTIQFYNYDKLNINGDTCDIKYDFLENVSIIKEVYAYEGEMVKVESASSLGKYMYINAFASSKGISVFSGLVLFCDSDFNQSGPYTYTIRLLNYYENTPCIIIVNIYCDSDFIVTDYDSTTQEISLK